MGVCGNEQLDRDQSTPARGRHLAEAAWWALTQQEVSRAARPAAASSFIDARVSAYIVLAFEAE